MTTRPKIKMKLTVTDNFLEIIGWMAIAVIWTLTITSYPKLPEIIPTHYNYAGEVDGYGGKRKILGLPIVATILFVGITILNKFPHIFNYPTKITENNALRQYSIATRMMRYLKLFLVVLLGLIVFKTIQNANGQTDGLGTWFLPLALGLIFLPVIYFMIELFKAK